jgi:hypothetical protein
MNLHARLMGFLLTCAVLIGLNVIATISGVYELSQGITTKLQPWQEMILVYAGQQQSEKR